MVLACCYWETGCLGLAAGGQCAIEVEAKKPAASHLHISLRELVMFLAAQILEKAARPWPLIASRSTPPALSGP